AGEPGWQSPLDVDWVQEALDRRFKVEIPVVPFPAPPRKHVRLSAQLYNSLQDYERLGDALEAVL
ncbi:MAG: aminotransferase, partial [Myxococcaceae bacterium]|nr:aminotransferase [Myxococcaceae bacterium]